MLDLTGKVAVVTGGGRGIGRGIALAFAKAGADVAVADYFGDRAESVAAEVHQLDRRAVAITADVRSKTALEEMVETTITELGRLDIAVANAGTGRGGSVLQMSEEDFDVTVDINMKGVFLTVQACARQMVRQGTGGRIITLASVAAERVVPVLFAYCGTKSAVRIMSRAWAQDLAPFAITVNSIGPGVIDTELAAALVGETDEARRANAAHIPAGRHGRPDDIGNLAVWLASNEAEYVTGTYNVMDGGLVDVGDFTAGNPYGALVDYVRTSRAQGMDGTTLLQSLDDLMAAGSTQAEAQRVARGIV